MLDIHTHLFWDRYDADREAVIARALDVGVEKMICVGTSPQDNSHAIEVAEKYEGIFASVGIHPHHFNEIGREFSISSFQFSNKSQFFNSKIQTYIEELRKLVQHKKVVAIGECGLDYFARAGEQPITDEQRVFQKEGFLAQIALAQELELPIIIHTRPSLGSMDAYEDMYAVLTSHCHSERGEESRNNTFGDVKDGIPRQARNDVNCILHCYQGDTEITKKFLELPHIYFSFSGSITYPVKKALLGTKDDSAEVVQLVPLERLFIETDCPFLAPQEKRGTRNEPAYVALTTQEICRLKGCSLLELEERLNDNWQKVFGTNTSR